MTPTKNPTPSDEETAVLLYEKDPKELLEPEDEPTKPYVYRVPERTAAYNRALLGEHKRRLSNPQTHLDAGSQILEDLKEDQKELEQLRNWETGLRKGTLAMGLAALIVAASPIVLVIIWAVSQ